MYFRLPSLSHVLGSRRIQRDHLRRLLVQEHEAERTLYKAMTHDQSLPIDIRLQVCLAHGLRSMKHFVHGHAFMKAACQETLSHRSSDCLRQRCPETRQLTESRTVSFDSHEPFRLSSRLMPSRICCCRASGCVLTGRSRSVHRFARLSRIMVRQLAHYGLLPGVTKSTW